MAGVALVAATLLGCQSNSDRDLIARDRRMQEDQIYALQDYITQYQQLLCRYRTENASLRRQLADGTVTESPSSLQPMTPPRTKRPSSTEPVTPPTPQFQTPIPPGAKERRTPPPPPQTPSDLQTPDVPPLNSSGDATPRGDAYADSSEGPRVSTEDVVTASYEVPSRGVLAAGEAASAAGEPRQNPHNRTDRTASNQHPTSNNILLSGKVVANSNGGPRIMVDVIPPTSADGQQPFEGSVSLMLLTTDANGEQHNVGRWDFNADDVHAAFVDGATRPTLRFFVEMPTRTNVDGPTTLWTRLVPRDGAKLLAHANVDLARPGIFSSRSESERSRLADELILAANCVEAPAGSAERNENAATFGDDASSEPVESSEVSATINEADWSIAQPGKPANLPPETADKTGAGGWRLSTEPMPVAVVQSTPATSVLPQVSSANTADSKSPLLEMLTGRESSAAVELAAEQPVRPNWAPGRDGETSARHVASRPSWSAKR